MGRDSDDGSERVSDADGDGESGDEGGRASHSTPRNVVLVVLDTARAADVGPETTPHLARLAREGTTFERAFAAAPWTVPSHASMFTGTYPSEHGAHGGHPALDGRLRTLPEAFADAGYETVGVSNNTWLTAEFGFDRGFDDLRRGWQYVQSDVDMGAVVRGECLAEKLDALRARLFDGNPVVNAANVLYSEFFRPAGDDGAERTTDWLANWLADGSDRPRFGFCNYIEPHVQYDPPRAHAERFLPEGASYEDATAVRQDPRAYDCGDYDLGEREFALLRGLYRAELAYVDEQVGRLRTALERAGAWEDTLLVVCGDHGEHVGEHGFFGHQYNLYDTLLHVPLVAHGGPFTGGGRRTELVQLLDLPATLLDAAGIDDPLADQGHGRSLVPGGGAQRDPRDAVCAEYVAPQPSIERLEARFGDLPDRVYAYDRGLRAIRTGTDKYVSGDDGFERLHHLPSDPHERTNLADERPGVAADLAERLDRQFGDVEPAESGEGVAMSDGTKARLADLGYL